MEISLEQLGLDPKILRPHLEELSETHGLKCALPAFDALIAAAEEIIALGDEKGPPVVMDMFQRFAPLMQQMPMAMMGMGMPGMDGMLGGMIGVEPSMDEDEDEAE